MANVLRITGDTDGAMAAGQQALKLVATLGERALQEQAAHRLGQTDYAIGDFGRAAALHGGTWRPRTGSLAGPVQTCRCSPGGSGADLEHARGLRRGSASRGGGAPPRSAGGPRGHTDHCPRCLGQLYLAQGDLEPAIRVYGPGPGALSYLRKPDRLRPIATALGMRMRSRDASRRGVRCWRKGYA